jgi:hypothetical protein
MYGTGKEGKAWSPPRIFGNDSARPVLNPYNDFSFTTFYDLVMKLDRRWFEHKLDFCAVLHKAEPGALHHTRHEHGHDLEMLMRRVDLACELNGRASVRSTAASDLAFTGRLSIVSISLVCVSVPRSA